MMRGRWGEERISHLLVQIEQELWRVAAAALCSRHTNADGTGWLPAVSHGAHLLWESSPWV